MNDTPTHPSNATVLIIDDDPESLLLVSTMVEYIGYRALTANTFDEAAVWFKQQPTAVLLDLVMPDRTSERIAAMLQETGNRVPVVLMSAAKRDRLGAQAAEYVRMDVNVVSTLAKPFWVDVLVSAMKQAIPETTAHLATSH